MLAHNLSKLTNLTTFSFSVSENNIGDDEIIQIMESIGFLNNLVNLELGLYENDISDYGVECIGEDLLEMKNL